jgi:hypothetical protein
LPLDKSDIEQLAALMQANADRLEERILNRIHNDIDQAKDQLREQIETVETRLLTEFHKWASPTAARIERHSAVLMDHDTQLEALRLRLAAIEEKLSPPH